MPINNTLDHDEKIIYSICTGLMTEQDFVEYIKRIWSHDAHYGYNEVFNTVEGNWDNFDFGFLLKVAENAAKLQTIDTDTKLAWIVLEGKQKDLTTFYKAAKSLTNTKSRSLEAFYSIDEAMTWLQSPIK